MHVYMGPPYCGPVDIALIYIDAGGFTSSYLLWLNLSGGSCVDGHDYNTMKCHLNTVIHLVELFHFYT